MSTLIITNLKLIIGLCHAYKLCKHKTTDK